MFVADVDVFYFLHERARPWQRYSNLMIKKDQISGATCSTPTTCGAVLCLNYSALRVPYVIAFDMDEFSEINGWFIINRIVDFIFLADILVIQNKTFLCFGCTTPVLTPITTRRSTKLFRVIKTTRTLRKVLLAVEMFLNLNFSVMSIFKFFCGIVLSAHLIACGFLFICFEEDDGWLSESNSGDTVLSLCFVNCDQLQSIRCLLARTVGFGDIRAVTD